jgi:hypothetical protein
MKYASALALMVALRLLVNSPLARAAAPPFDPAAGSAASSTTLAIVGVTVIDATGAAPRANTTVLIKGGCIKVIGPTGKVVLPPGTRKIDGRGKYLIPGLWDMHVHVTHDCFRELFLAYGVTGVRHMYSFDPWFSPRRWRNGMAQGKLVAPHLVMSDSMVDGPRAALPWLLRRNVYTVRDARSARAEVEKFKRRGEDFVKVYPCLSREAFLAVLEQAGKVGLPVAGHVPHAISVAEASARGMACVEHLSGWPWLVPARSGRCARPLSATWRPGG